MSGEQGRLSKLTQGSGSTAVNQKIKDGQIDKQPEGTEARGKSSGQARDGDESGTGKSLQNEAWFTRLPPELRKSIRSGIGRTAPRAYEERRRSIFKASIEPGVLGCRLRILNSDYLVPRDHDN